jgi:hydrogenase nickel incorporation protein HypA/HybF
VRKVRQGNLNYMHEIGIANSILEAVKVETSRRPDAIPRKVAVRIGELAAVDPEALRFCFEALTRETELESLQLEIEICPRKHHCPDCDFEFPVVDFELRCPKCGQEHTHYISGDQLELAYLEMEEHEPSTA